ncbi:MAG: pyridoxal 5'-phosphate synthase glutaminase subunit PdxT, partial [Chloroflexaceae bacterium]|nr:pyridoxal 5'-phosphate synthase glutaminase subunit PdxT [Chloroflexaceae bacterium]
GHNVRGAILMARTIIGGIDGQPRLGLMDMAVRRNAYGRQVDSFEAALPVAVFGQPPVHGVFIRAPIIESVGADVTVLAEVPGQQGVVAAQQGRHLATTFHPELTGDDRFHRYFLEL